MQQWHTAIQVIGIGWYMVISILFGLLGGRWLDNKLGTKPLFLIAGIILGLVVAGYGAYQMVKPLMSNNRDKGE